MSEPSTDPAAKPAGEQKPETKPEPKGTDWEAEAKKWEKRAKENKGAADRLAELEEAQKTEAQKLADRAQRAEEERDQAQAQLMRRDVAAAANLPAEVADRLKGSTREELEQDARSFAALLGDRQTAARDASLVDPSAGKQTEAGASVAEQFAASLPDL
jgi:hypothetical protein